MCWISTWIRKPSTRTPLKIILSVQTMNWIATKPHKLDGFSVKTLHNEKIKNPGRRKHGYRGFERAGQQKSNEMNRIIKINKLNCSHTMEKVIVILCAAFTLCYGCSDTITTNSTASPEVYNLVQTITLPDNYTIALYVQRLDSLAYA